jgi:hypothetical protein
MSGPRSRPAAADGSTYSTGTPRSAGAPQEDVTTPATASSQQPHDTPTAAPPPEPPASTPTKETIRIKEPARRPGSGISSAHDLFQSGKFRGYRVGRRIRVYAASIGD